MEATQAQITVRAPLSVVMGIIADLPAYPEWTLGVASAEVLQRSEDGLPLRAHLSVSSGPFAEEVEFRYTWTPPGQVDWELVTPGLITQLHGRYTCTDNGDETTDVSYDLSLELSVPMIGTVRQRAERSLLRGALQGLKKRAEGAVDAVEG